MRLNAQAKQCLLGEIEKQAQPLSLDVPKQIVLKRLDKVTTEDGPPLAKAELAALVLDMFPQFNPQVLEQAAKANRASTLKSVKKPLLILSILGGSVLALAGLVWLVNLPYPMVRRPVARVAPILLLPSYLSMDRNYREAIAHGEQADQLVNNATSEKDIDLGAEKVKLAQANLDQLPVWFLGYEPVMVCQMMGCSWHFTFDEFNRARAQVGRMDARIFQEKNALTQLKTAEQDLTTAKTDYQQAKTSQQQLTAITAWKNALTQLELIPPQTLAKNAAQIKLNVYQQEFQEIARSLSGIDQTQTMIAAADQFAKIATQQTGNGPHTVQEWQGIQQLWQEAIARLQQVQPQAPDYLAAQTALADYTKNRLNVENRLNEEKNATEAFSHLKTELNHLLTQQTPFTPAQAIAALNPLLEQLQTIPPGTTVYAEAQTLVKQGQAKIKELRATAPPKK